MLLLHWFCLFFTLITPLNSASLNRSPNETSNYEEFREYVIKTISSYLSSYFEPELSERMPIRTHNEISSNEESEFRDLCIGPLCIQTPDFADTFFRTISNYISP